VEFFEQRYQDFPGLNLSRETLEGIQKHETFFDRPGGETVFSPHLECQLVDISDEIAYLSADLEDALRGKFITLEDLKKIHIPAAAMDSLSTPEQQVPAAIVRRVIRHLLRHIVSDTEAHIKTFRIQTLQDVQRAPQRIVLFAPDFYVKFRELKNFLFERYYLVPEVQSFTEQGQRIISGIFDFLHKHPAEVPHQKIKEAGSVERRICDYIAGMTDDFIRAQVERYGLRIS
jgi:dGTPase